MATASQRSAEEVCAEQVLGGTLGTMEMLSIYLGDQLGWYAALRRRRSRPPRPSWPPGRRRPPRYAREWLEQQAVYGLLHVDERAPSGASPCPPATAEVLTRRRQPVLPRSAGADARRRRDRDCRTARRLPPRRRRELGRAR